MRTYFGTVLVLKKLNKAYRALTHHLMCECFLRINKLNHLSKYDKLVPSNIMRL